MAREGNIRVSIKEYKSLLREVIQHNLEVGKKGLSHHNYIALHVTSIPGVGKSSGTHQVFDELGLKAEIIIAATKEPTDLCGIPEAVNSDATGHLVRVTDWVMPEEFNKPFGHGYVFDEVTKAPHMMNALGMLVYDRRVGSHAVPDGSTIVCLGNRTVDNAGDTDMPTHLADRLCFIEIYSTAKLWLEHASNVGISPLLMGFIANKGEGAFMFDPKRQKNSTQRSWMSVDNILKLNLSHGQRLAMISGYVGEDGASAFATYLRYADEMETPEKIIANPKGVKLPEGDQAKAKLYAMVSNLIGHCSVKTISPIMEFLERVPMKEIVVFAVQDMMIRVPAVNASPALRNWKLANIKLLTGIT